VTQKRGQK